MILNQQQSTIGSAARKVACLIFFIALCVPAVIGALKLDSRSDELKSENRTKTAWPELAGFRTNFTAYTAQINDYLSDHVGLRESFLAFYAKARYRFLNLGVSDKALIGREGWLFYTEGNVLQNTQGKIPFSNDEALLWLEKIQQLKQFVEGYGGRLVVLIVPEKDQVYPEYLPSHIDYSRENRRADSLKRFAASSEITLLNLLDPMLQAKESGRLYFKSDSHWTQRGAYIAYRELVRNLQEQGLNVPFEPWESLVPTESVRVSGDLSTLLNLENEFAEQAEVHIPVHKQQDRQTSTSAKPSLLLIGDSFSARLNDFLPSSFVSVLFVHHNFKSIPIKTIDQRKPDVVVLEIVERALDQPFELGNL